MNKGYKKLSVLSLFIFLLTSIIHAQIKDPNKGNEDEKMYNQVATRDADAINEAETGWWRKSQENKEQRIQKWKKATFGLFITWGVYARYGNIWKGKPGSVYSEHLMRVKKISRQEYLDSARLFNPVKFNAEEWVLLAKKAGINYIVMMAKHHDGFVMYPTEIRPEYSLKSTQFKRDPMAELAAACKKHGILFGFYYSHAFDWEDPDAPGNDWEFNNPGGDKLLGGANWFDTHPEWLPKAQRYVNNKSIPQIKELITKYHPDLFWFDTPHKLPLSENLRILKTIWETDPNIVINGRLTNTSEKQFGDYKNTADRPEEFYPVPDGTYWEAIPTTNDSYGFSYTDKNFKPAGHFIQLLAKATAMNGNLLMNIGPKGDGSIDTADVRILEGIALWMKKNKQTVIDVQPSPLPRQQWGVITQRNKELYLHVFKKPTNGIITVGGFSGKIKSVQWEASGKKIKNYTVTQNTLLIPVTDMQENATDEVIVITTLDPVKALADKKTIYVDGAIPENRLLSFYAQQHGKPLTYADGKRNNYLVRGWTDTTQYLTWDVNLVEPATFKVYARYTTEAKTGGRFILTIGDQLFTNETNADATGGLKKIEVGRVSLKPGAQQIILKPTAIKGGELMKFLELVLVSE